ncbi:MAG: gfo/Idh/MocA family oxidoreductase [Chloroflexi bacterium]|nr:MAG: gfo/Idh/MocA family oxidoreductase [Chloroflexota bacterium]
MTQNEKIKIAVIGVGVMGSLHARDIDALENTELAAICDTDQALAAEIAEQYAVPAFYDHREMLEQVELDAILIATPHYDHPPIACDAFERGIHVLTEKPIGVHVQPAQEMIAAYEVALEKHPKLMFAGMFQQRTYGFWKKIKSLIDEGELGKLFRTTWIITDWFRTQSYYDNGGWRATWKGEGGGVLLNQCPHNIDLYQWLVGMPKRITGFASIGKYHNIEVEDEVTGYFEYENGMIGHLITSTAESPGTNRLEIVGEKGKLTFEDGVLTFYRNRYSSIEYIKTSISGYEPVENWKIEIPFEHHGEAGHKLIIENFANAILDDEELIAPAVEGINSLELGNAIMLSSFLGHTIDLPMDAAAYAEKLEELIENSNFQKVVVKRDVTDVGRSF